MQGPFSGGDVGHTAVQCHRSVPPAAVVQAQDAGRVVLGLPLDPDGEHGRAARSVEAFAARLRAALDVPVELIDESFTTVEAEDVLLQADLSRARRKEVVDRVAAAVILRRWLDAEAARKRREL